MGYDYEKGRNEIREDFLKYLDKKGMIDLTCELIKKKTVNPPGNEYLTKDIVISSLKEIGAKIEIIEKDKSRPNILGYIGEGEPSVAILAHMDVVPPGSGWDNDPFSPWIKEGKIYGRGAIDNKGPYAAAWAGIKAILRSGLPFKGSIILGAVADEERGSKMGVEYLLEKGFSPSFCLIPDSGGIKKVIRGEKGLLQVRFSTSGISAHGSTPEQGENAIYKMIGFLPLLKEFKFKGDYHPAFDEPTLNLGEIRGGEAPNIVPDRCEVILDIRYPLGMNKDNLVQQLKELIKNSGIEVKTEVISFNQPHLLKEDNPLISAFRKAAESMGVKINFGTAGGITVAKNLYFKGISSLSHCPAEESAAHQANEYVKIDNLLFCAQLWAEVIYRVLNKEMY